MPFLPIDSSVVFNPNRTHLALIESWMLWPHDEVLRLEAYKSAVVTFARDHKQQMKLDPSIFEELFDLTAEARPLHRIAELAEDPFRDGFMAGNILIVALEGRDEKGNRLKLGDIHDKLRKLFARQKGDNSKFVNSIWQKYRPVSHLWAAHITLAGSNSKYAFPCELKDVIEFLWVSEEWRQRGEATKSAPKAPSTILIPGKCVRTPEAMKFSK
jgi:hypothetical protein